MAGGGMQGGYTYPAPVRKSGGSSCLIWGLVGCGVLAVLAIVLVLVSAVSISHNKELRNIISNAAALPSCGQKLVTVRSALRRYEDDHKGKYPPELSALVPKYLPDQSMLTCGTGSTAMPLEYTSPKPNAPGDTPVVTFRGPETSFMRRQAQQSSSVRLLKDGRIVSEQVTRTEIMPAESSGSE